MNSPRGQREPGRGIAQPRRHLLAEYSTRALGSFILENGSKTELHRTFIAFLGIYLSRPRNEDNQSHSIDTETATEAEQTDFAAAQKAGNSSVAKVTSATLKVIRRAPFLIGLTPDPGDMFRASISLPRPTPTIKIICSRVFPHSRWRELRGINLEPKNYDGRSISEEP